MEIVTFAEIQKVKSSFEFKNSISSTRNCNEFRFFEPRFTSLVSNVVHNMISPDFSVSYLLLRSPDGLCQTYSNKRHRSIWYLAVFFSLTPLMPFSTSSMLSRTPSDLSDDDAEPREERPRPDRALFWQEKTHSITFCWYLLQTAKFHIICLMLLLTHSNRHLCKQVTRYD